MTFLLRSKLKKLAHFLRVGATILDKNKVNTFLQLRKDLEKVNPFIPNEWRAYGKLYEELSDKWSDGGENEDEYDDLFGGFTLNSDYSGEVVIDNKQDLLSYFSRHGIVIKLPRVTRVILKNFYNIDDLPSVSLPNCRDLELTNCILVEFSRILDVKKVERLKISGVVSSLAGFNSLKNLKVLDATDSSMDLISLERFLTEGKSNSLAELYLANKTLEPHFIADRKKFFTPKLYKQLKNNFPNLKKHDITALKVGEFSRGERGALSLVDNKEQGSLSLTASSIRRLANYLRSI